MHRFGISVYPEHSTFEKDLAYIKMAAKYGFTRIFTCLLSVEAPPNIILEQFGSWIREADELGFTVGVDTNPEVFTYLNAKPDDLKVFADMGVKIIRLDGHFSDREDIALTHNPYGIAIEFNASSNISLDLMLERGADIHNMVTCHNFYPQKYTGLGWDRFMKFTNKYKDLGMAVAAFVSSNNQDTFGPWPVYDGLATCEIHRGMPIDLQARHLLATGKIDDILIGNAFAAEEELQAMSRIDTSRITLCIETERDIWPEEERILYSYSHFDRGDASDILIRSIGREDFENVRIPERECTKTVLKPGDIVVVNDRLSHYRGEMQIIKKEVPLQPYWNYVGKVKDEERMLLGLLEPEYLFGFMKE